jgi:hypothetical protein
MDEYERKRLLDRARRNSGTIGTDLPGTVTVQGTEIDLREFVFECKRVEGLSEDQRDRVDEVKRQLKRERLARIQRLDDGDVSVEEGEALVEEIRGFDRAFTALDGLDAPSYSETLRQKRKQDARRLLSLVEQLPD